MGNFEDLVEQKRREREQQSPPKPESRRPAEPETFTAEDLRLETFPPLSWFLRDIIPSEGVTLLCSKPKFGKSWLALDAAIAATANRYTLGEIKPDQGDILYLALEDSPRRLQRRITKLLPTFKGKWPEGLEIATKWKRLHEGGLDEIRAWCERVKQKDGKPIAIVIDVLAKIRKPTGNRQAYEADYEALTGLCELANELCIAVIVIHHVRKMAADDLMETVSGSFGIVGAVDTVLVMAPGKTGGAVLDIRGRDVESAELAIQFSKDNCKWTILGTAAEVHQSDQRKAIIAALAERGAPMEVKELVAATNMKRNNLDALLVKMVREGTVLRVKTGVYALHGHTPPPDGKSDRSDRPHTTTDQTPIRPQATDKNQESARSDRSDRSDRILTSNGPPKKQEERDRKTCVELYRKVLDAERERSQWLLDHPATVKPDLSANTQSDRSDQTDLASKPLESPQNTPSDHLIGPKSDRSDQSDDLPLPDFLDRRNDPVCAYCGRPGGRTVACDGLQATVHEECERGWLLQLDQKLWATAGSSQ
jgi:hypothetical protein